jgi:L-histidine N-alpha-methyltransferase
MRLRARARPRVRLATLHLTIDFAAREELRTEISTRERVDADQAAAGLEVAGRLTDPDELVAVTLARPARPG